MLKPAITIACSIGLLLLGPVRAQEVPPGHPPIDTAPTSRPAPPPANPADVESVDAIILAYYDVISGAAGEDRNWERFHSLFVMKAQFITVKDLGSRANLVMLTADEFVEMNRGYFKKSGYFEQEVHRKIDRFGNVAQVFSTYEARQRLGQEPPYSRGINSIQLVSNGSRWWIASVMWEYERETNPIPTAYLDDATD